MTDSPWDKVQHFELLATGVWVVDTAGHGGIMVAVPTAMKRLSAAARKHATFKKWKGFYCYEEDCDACIVLYELDDVREKMGGGVSKESVRASLGRWNKDYVKDRGGDV